MHQQKKQGFRAKLSSYFRMLCGRPLDPPKAEIEQPIDHRPTVKRKRLTFILDRALVKLSRKNIGGDEFSAKQQVQQQVEKHMAQRLAGVSLAVFVGQFGEALVNSVYFPIQILPSPPPPLGYITPNNEIVANSRFPLRKTPKGIQVFILWVGVDAANSAIESTLLKYHAWVQHFIFYCEGGLRMSDLHELFVLYRQEYMFEVEKVMLLDKCVKTLVYVSRSQHFLSIDRGSLIEFCCEQLGRREGGLQRMQFGCLLDRLFESGMYVEAASVLGDLIVTTDQVVDFEKRFGKMMQERYSYCTGIVRRVTQAKARRTTAQNQLTEQNVPKFHQNTPLFGLVQHNSVRGNFSESVATRKNLGASFGRAISFKMGEWEQ